MASALTFTGLSKRFASGGGIGPIDLEVAAGTTTVLLGASGCGKSTLLRTIIGLEPPSAGSVFLGKLPIQADTLDQVRHLAGYVIQEGGLFPHLSAGDNATLAADARHLDPEHIADRLQSLCALVHLDEKLLTHYPAQLSGGQRQRVALIRALMLDPQVLLLDEPLAALDPLLRHRLRQDLKRLFKELGKTVLLVTHDLMEAAYLADQVVLLRDGLIEQRGTPEQLMAQPASLYVQQFISAQQFQSNDGSGGLL